MGYAVVFVFFATLATLAYVLFKLRIDKSDKH